MLWKKNKQDNMSKLECKYYYNIIIAPYPIKNRRHLSIRDAGYSKFFLIL